MANHLKMATIHAIVTLYGQGWSKRRIARELGLDRETVARHITLAGPNPATPGANPPLGAEDSSGGVAGAKPATNPPHGAAGAGEEAGAPKPATAPPNPPHGARPGPASDSEPFRALIQEKFGQGLSARRIYQDLAGDEHCPSYESIKRFIRLLKQTAVLPFRRLEVEPGQESQVDFGTGAPVVSAEGRVRQNQQVAPMERIHG